MAPALPCRRIVRHIVDVLLYFVDGFDSQPTAVVPHNYAAGIVAMRQTVATIDCNYALQCFQTACLGRYRPQLCTAVFLNGLRLRRRRRRRCGYFDDATFIVNTNTTAAAAATADAAAPATTSTPATSAPATATTMPGRL